LSQSTPPQRRAADRNGGGSPDREGILRLLFVGVLVAIIGVFGWWYWRHATGDGVVRDGTPSWTPDSKHVIFSSELDGKTDLFVTDLTGRERQQLTTTPASNEAGAAYSPDGKSIAFETDRDGNLEIYRMRSDGGVQQPLTRHPGRDQAPSWSPDGRSIVFMSTRDNPEFDVYRMDADGKNVERLTTAGNSQYPQYSPDGSQIAMHIGRDVQVLDLKTRQLRRLTYEPLNGMYPTWSSDASQIAFMTWRNGRTELFIAKSTGEQQLLVSMPTGDAIEPRWSPDDHYIAFVHVPGGVGPVENTREPRQQRIAFIVDVKTGRLTRLSR
jgi:Tol biopolymer transport system component